MLTKNHFINICLIYFFWILAHYICAHLYTRFCAPLNFWGLLLSPLVVPAPHCRALRWVINIGGDTITQMWIVLGTYLTSKLLIK